MVHEGASNIKNEKSYSPVLSIAHAIVRESVVFSFLLCSDRSAALAHSGLCGQLGMQDKAPVAGQTTTISLPLHKEEAKEQRCQVPFFYVAGDCVYRCN